MKLLTYGKYFVLTASFFFLLSGCKPPSEKAGNVQAKIDSISSWFVPDHRMGISDIKAKAGLNETLVLAGETTSPGLRDSIIKALNKTYNELIDSIIILPDAITNINYSGLVTLSVINMRKYPDDSAEMVSQAILGTPVRILKSKDSWYLIQTPDNYLGWTESYSVEPLTSAGMAEWKNAEKVIAQVNSGWIYTSPDESGIVGDIVAGCIFVREGESQGYTSIRLPDGRRGYINSKSVTDFSHWKANVKCTEESIVRCATTLIGLPYLWGGTSSKAVDCSGFSKTVYFLNGLILFRDASQQALHGIDVDIKGGYGHMRPGDILLFGSRDNSKSRVTHVAIYLGDSEYINASGRVQINSLDSTRSNYNSHRVRSLLAAKRIIGATGDPGITPVKSHPWY